MSDSPDVIAPLETVTFTVTAVPKRPAQRKTIARLMKMQPDLQRALKGRAKSRRQKDNVVYIRAGRKWTNRAKATLVAHVETGETFTLTLTPQIIPDVKSVQSFLKAEKTR